jgi:isocitrate dehydrogenase
VILFGQEELQLNSNEDYLPGAVSGAAGGFGLTTGGKLQCGVLFNENKKGAV